MGRDGLEARLRGILVDQLGYRLPAGKIAATTPLIGKGLGLTSLDVVTLVLILEECFDVMFEADELSGMVGTFGSLVAAIETKLARASAPPERGPTV